MSNDPNLERLYKQMSMDDLDVVEEFGKAGWSLVALTPNQFQWQHAEGGKSPEYENAREIVKFAQMSMEAVHAHHKAEEGLLEMPQDLADAGWTFERDGEEIYAVHEELMLRTSRDQEDLEKVIAEAYRIQEDYERQRDEQIRTPATPTVQIIGRAVVPPPQGDLIAVDLIRLDGGTQMRVEPLNMLKVAEYAELMRAGKQFPPVDVFFDGDNYWLGDGFYRHAATLAAELEEILATIHKGTQRDAILFAVGANAEHGLPRTNADKRRAVEKLLLDDEWRAWTDGRIADAAGVSAPFVKTIRDEFTLNGLESPTMRIGKDNRVIDTSRIGDREAAAALAAAQPVLPGAEAAVAEIETAGAASPASAPVSTSDEEPNDVAAGDPAPQEAPVDVAPPATAAQPEATLAQTAAAPAPSLDATAAQPETVEWPDQDVVISITIKAGKSSKRSVAISGRSGMGAPVFLPPHTLADLHPLPPPLATLALRLNGNQGTTGAAESVTPSAPPSAPAAPATGAARKKPAARAKKAASSTKKKPAGKSRKPAKQARK